MQGQLSEGATLLPSGLLAVGDVPEQYQVAPTRLYEVGEQPLPAPLEAEYQPCPKRQEPMGRFDRMLWEQALAPVRHQAYLAMISARAGLAEKQRLGARAGRR